VTARTVSEAPTVHGNSPKPMARLPLRAELFLLAHNDDTGEPRVNEQSLAVGLAGAVLLELWLAQRVEIGWAVNSLARQWQRHPGHLTLTNDDPVGDPLSDAALATIRHTHHLAHSQSQLKAWLRHFAAADLYQRVRANMVAVGVLRHASRRRYGLVKTDTYLAVHDAWAVRARAHIGSVTNGYEHPQRPGREEPDEQCVALCGLVDVLELAPFLYHPAISDTRLRHLLRHIVHQHNPTIRDVIAAVDAGRGDLAVAAMG
jgi:hypothetical protein